MSLTQRILQLSKEIEQEKLAEPEGVSNAGGNPIYMQMIAGELLEVAMASLSLKKYYFKELLHIRKGFLKGEIDEETFCMKTLTYFDAGAYDLEEMDVTNSLLNIYYSVKKQMENNIGFLTEKESGKYLAKYAEKLFNLFLSSLPHKQSFLENNAVVDELVEDYTMGRIDYIQMYHSINDFYLDWEEREREMQVN